MNRSTFAHPDDFFRGTDFWMLNDRLTEDGIVAQLHEMKKQGVYSFIARTYIGLKSDYPGKDFMHKMHVIVDTAKQLGLKVFIQAGYMPEAVVGLPEESALRYIIAVKKGEEDSRRVFCECGEYSFVEHNSRTFLDMFDPDAMEYYLKKSYEEMWAEFSDEYGKTVISVWVDEPSYDAAYLPYTPKLDSLFRSRYGYELAPNIHKLYFDCDGAETLRYHYRVLLRDLLEENYFAKVRKWCTSHGLLFSGHLMMEETMTSQIRRASACMPYYKYFDVPGIDILGASMNWVDSPIGANSTLWSMFVLYNTAMQCVSAARQNGQKHVLAEMYGVSGEDMGFRNQLSMFDQNAAMGITHRSVHGIFYSLRGRGKRAYPPHVSYYQPYFEKYHAVTDYCARVGEFISDGVTEGEIAIVHPLESGYTMFKGPIGSMREGVGDANYDNKLLKLLMMLKAIHRDPELCDLSTLRDLGRVENGRLVVGEMSYGTLILPELKVITANLLSLLETFANDGGRVIVLGDIPTMLDGYIDATLKARIRALPGVLFADSLESLERLIADDKVAYKLIGRGARNLLVNRRKVDGGVNFFIYNNDCAHSAPATLEVDGEYRVYICDGIDGSVKPIAAECTDGRTYVKLDVPCGAGVMLALEEGEPIVLAPEKPETLIRLDADYTILPEDDNTLLLEYWQYKTDGEFSRPLPVAAIQRLLTDADYRGKLTLRTKIESQIDIDSLALALESPEEQIIRVDGRAIPSEVVGYYRDRAFETVTLGSLSRGVHTLELERDFVPLSKYRSAINSLFETQLGVELECAYLLGKFGVRTLPSFTRNGCVQVANSFVLTDAPQNCDGELTVAGYPFFTGRLKLATKVTLDSLPEKAEISLGVLNAGVADVIVNGVNVGTINRVPERVDCTSALRIGENTVEFRLYTTLRNIVGPFHRPQGEVGNTFGGGYVNPDAAWLSVDVSKPGWEDRLTDCSSGFIGEYNLAPLGVDCAVLYVK